MKSPEIYPPNSKKNQRTESIFIIPNRQVNFVISCLMRMITERIILTVARHDSGWSVEQDGIHFGQSADKEVAKAAANRRARSLQDDGQLCQVRVSGEHGYWAKS